MSHPTGGFSLFCCRKPAIFKFKVNSQDAWAVKIPTAEVAQLWHEPGAVGIKTAWPFTTPRSPREVRGPRSLPQAESLSPSPKMHSMGG